MRTRRDLLCGAAAAVPAAAMAGVASAAPADPDERLEAAVQELLAAMQAKWPGSKPEAIKFPSWEGRNLDISNPTVALVAMLPRGTP